MPKPDNVGVGVAVLVINSESNSILLLKRKGAHASEKWACPGGWVDATDDCLERTCCRELLEELNLVTLMDELKLVTAVTEWHPEIQCQTVTVYYVLDFAKAAYNIPVGFPKVVEKDKCAEVMWFDKKQAMHLDLFPKLDEVLKSL